jgi:hypothetical protein
MDGFYTSCHLLAVGTRGAVMSVAVVDLAEPQSIHLVTTDDREDVHVYDEHQQQRCEEQHREHCPELEMPHETVNRISHLI